LQIWKLVDVCGCMWLCYHNCITETKLTGSSIDSTRLHFGPNWSKHVKAAKQHRPGWNAKNPSAHITHFNNVRPRRLWPWLVWLVILTS
jgi:hypothetical protein